MAKKTQPKAAANADPQAPQIDEAALKAKKKEFRQMKARYMELREMLKAAAAERKALEARLAPLAMELGMPFKGVKNSTPVAS